MPTATDADDRADRPWAGPLALIIFVAALTLEERRLLSGLLVEGLPPLLNSLSVPLAVAGLALLIPLGMALGLPPVPEDDAPATEG